MFLPHPRVKVSIVGSLRDREVACSASDRQGSNFESCVWRTVPSHSSHHPQEVLLAQLSLYVHKGGLKPDSFHFISFVYVNAYNNFLYDHYCEHILSLCFYTSTMHSHCWLNTINIIILAVHTSWWIKTFKFKKIPRCFMLNKCWKAMEFRIFTHLKLCLATATHNFKWVKITHICLVWEHTFAHRDV